MLILLAEDDPSQLELIRSLIEHGGDEVVATANGTEALRLLQEPMGPELALLDWDMPGHSGPDVCRALRATGRSDSLYLLLVTAQTQANAVVEGLLAGADDFVSKPFRHPELVARMEVGKRGLELNRKLRDRIGQLEEALAHVRQLRELIPVCSYCGLARNDKGYWQALEEHIVENAGTSISHGICPDCLARAKSELDRQHPERSA